MNADKHGSDPYSSAFIRVNKIPDVLERRLGVIEIRPVVIRSSIKLLHPALGHSQFLERRGCFEPFHSLMRRDSST